MGDGFLLGGDGVGVAVEPGIAQYVDDLGEVVAGVVIGDLSGLDRVQVIAGADELIVCVVFDPQDLGAVVVGYADETVGDDRVVDKVYIKVAPVTVTGGLAGVVVFHPVGVAVLVTVAAGGDADGVAFVKNVGVAVGAAGVDVVVEGDAFDAGIQGADFKDQRIPGAAEVPAATVPGTLQFDGPAQDFHLQVGGGFVVFAPGQFHVRHGRLAEQPQ